jgi:hypothetical protein
MCDIYVIHCKELISAVSINYSPYGLIRGQKLLLKFLFRLSCGVFILALS